MRVSVSFRCVNCGYRALSRTSLHCHVVQAHPKVIGKVNGYDFVPEESE